MKLLKIFLVLFIISNFSLSLFGQVNSDTSKPAAPATRQIIILRSERLNYKKVDTTEYQSAGGDVLIQQQSTLFYCDSVVLNKNQNMLQAYGHVHINDNDSVQTYSDYLRYIGNTKKAYLSGNVKLTDGKGTLTTPDLDYDVNTKTGIYTKGGKVVSDSTVLTSKEGTYYGTTRDVYFKKNVKLLNPQYNVITDTLLFNTYTNIATFVVPTTITSANNRRKIITSDGYYNLKTDNAYFGKRPHIEDSTTTLDANEVATDSTGYSEAKGNVVYRDTAQGAVILANNLKSNKIEQSFLATQQPILILKQDKDSIYIAADTLFSGRLSQLKRYRVIPKITDSVPPRSLLAKPVKKTVVEDSSMVIDSLTTDDAMAVTTSSDGKDTLIKSDTVTITTPFNNKDTLIKTVSPAINDTSSLPNTSVVNNFAIKDSTIKTDSLIATFPTPKNDSADRFVEAYYNVRIFSDSLQAVGDSLFYSGEDSAFRLFRNPVLWSQQSQISGDTIYLYTKHKQPDRLYVFENAFTLQKLNTTDFYNQVRGRTTNAYFKDGNIDYVRTKGAPAESVYYAQDDSSRFVGMNRATSDVIDMYFVNKEANRVVFLNNLEGTSYPMRQIKQEDAVLRGFKWQEARRPKTKYDLFGN